MMDLYIRELKKLVSRVEEFALPQYTHNLELIDKLIAYLSDNGITVPSRYISRLAGFNPWSYLNEVNHRVKATKDAIRKIKAGKYKRPGVVFSNLYRSMENKPDELIDRVTTLVYQFENLLYGFLDEDRITSVDQFITIEDGAGEKLHDNLAKCEYSPYYVSLDELYERLKSL